MSCACARALRSMVSSARAAGSLVEPPAAQHVRPAEDGGQRRAQLVRDGGEELVLEAVGALGLGARRALAREQPLALLLGRLRVGDVERDADHPARLAFGACSCRARSASIQCGLPSGQRTRYSTR